MTRRGLLGYSGAVAAAATTLPLVVGDSPAQAAPGDVDVQMTVNGSVTRLTVDPRETLLDVLRERLRLTGTKKGCDRGQCGACTVHVDAQRVLSCLTLVATVNGAVVTTIEGLSDGDRLHPLQQAFLDHDGFQCGYCTPGQIMSAAAIINDGQARTDEEIRERMSGNICRCTRRPSRSCRRRRPRPHPTRRRSWLLPTRSSASSQRTSGTPCCSTVATRRSSSAGPTSRKGCTSAPA